MISARIARLIRPEYIYQPGRLIRRIIGKTPGCGGEAMVELPWDMHIEVDTSEAIGRIISHHGIFELPVIEAMFRLVDPDDTILDVGANIGYMTAVALAAGAKMVISFEPHPLLFARLTRNVARWNEQPRFAARLNARNEAIDSAAGRSILFVPEGTFAGNQGIATLEPKTGPGAFDKVDVACTTLDAVVEELRDPIGLLKIDIEGHELHAFKGASKALCSGKIRDIIYESFEEVDSDVSRCLAESGIRSFAFEAR